MKYKQNKKSLPAPIFQTFSKFLMTMTFILGKNKESDPDLEHCVK